MRGSDDIGGLVGRERELAVLGGSLDGLTAGAGGMLAVTGGPGMGKSRLLTELTTRATACGMIVLWGSASEFEPDLPFAPMIDALDAYLVAILGYVVGGLGDDVLSRLA